MSDVKSFFVRSDKFLLENDGVNPHGYMSQEFFVSDNADLGNDNEAALIEVRIEKEEGV